MDGLGLLRRVDPRAVDDDPFWSAVRQRHPDVDLVLLPPPGAAGAAGGDRGDGADRAAGARGIPGPVLDEVARALADAWRAIAPVVAAAGADDPPSVAWRGRPGGHALVVQKALPGTGLERGTAVLRSVAGRLGGDGWLLRPSSRGEVAVLAARGPAAELRGEAGPGATVLTLAGPVLPVGREERARVREEVRSWL
ncbi:hypothetical protein L615_001200000760 [Nocardioides sp. J9]|uniref:hypothetical protein n=1 Tax=unclassified Nocardioides TaxID=2615069 RepID=UPI0004905CE1|nr:MULTISPECIES: hypothetical protein [unclassified Nocardioides]TWH03207.1 hypothetical protein L615_001200000760 [Nocardioides sp. J9]